MKKIKEDIAMHAHSMQQDHEIQMARAELYHLAKNAIALHKLLQGVSEQQGLEAWVSAKITKAADYIQTVSDHIEYDIKGLPMKPKPMVKLGEDASAGATSAGNIATVAKPLNKKKIIRRIG